MSIKHDHTLNPVVALAFYSNPAGTLLVLAGEGCFLKVFEADSSKLVCLVRVFESQTIHGIAVRDAESQGSGLEAAVWGGRSLILFGQGGLEALLLENPTSIEGLGSLVSDWILDIAISPYDGSCVLVTAHNTVHRARLGKDGQAIHLETLNSPSRSILYSAHLIWESLECVLVAAGTVFGEIIAWRCFVSERNPPVEARILATLTGHEGSIFGVNISPPILGPRGRPTRLLASCSDDRTIRIWDFYGDWASDNSDVNSGTTDSTPIRETGFGDNGLGGSSSQPVRCLTTVMGHASRIWRVRFQNGFSNNPTTTSLRVLSFGEDSTSQQWALDYDVDSQAQRSSGALEIPTVPSNACTLTHLNTFAFHSGKHIWSTAIRNLSEVRALLVSGGADGKISSYEIHSSKLDGSEKALSTVPDKSGVPSLSCKPSADCTPYLEAVDLGYVLGTLQLDPDLSVPATEDPTLKTISEDQPTISADEKPSKRIKPQKLAKDAFNRYAFVSTNHILVTTTFGRVLLGGIGLPIKWQELLLPEPCREDLKSYSIVKSIPELGVALLAGASGNIYLYRFGLAIVKVAQVKGKVADVFVLPNFEPGRIDFVVTTLGGKDAIFFAIDRHTTSALILSTVSYRLPDGFIVTSVGKSREITAFGSRRGTLTIFWSEGNLQPLQTWVPDETIDNGDALTSITHLPSSSNNQHYFLTTGRNGTYSVFAVAVTYQEDVVAKSIIRQVHRGTPPLGPNIEAAWFEGSDLLLYGFKSKNFIVWNETKQCEVMNVECGGAHRSHAYSPIRDHSSGYFIYTKASKLYIYSQRNSSHKIIKHGGHGREIKTCAISPDHRFIATGAEDTTIRIWEYDYGESSLRNHFDCLAVIQKHSAGIQHLLWHGSEYLFSSGGNEEFFIWAVEPIPGSDIGIVCEAGCPDQSEERDLRIMNFDVSEDTEYSQSPERQLLISLAYSDSTIRTYRYSRSAGFNILARGRYTSSCLMQIRHIQVTREELYLLTAATDGRLAIWKTASTLPSDTRGQPAHQLIQLSTHKLHQNSIKSLDIATSDSKNNIIVATGGDDNALGISIYHSKRLDSKPKSIILRSAHAAAITGLCFIPGCHPSQGDAEEELRVVSSSNDQRVKEWSIRVDGEGQVRLGSVGDTFTSVADAGDVAFLSGYEAKRAIVVGNGMEVFRVSAA